MSAESTTTGPVPGNLGRVLVIDDEPGIRRFALRVIESAGYQVIEAGDGPQGLEIFARQKPEIVAIVMDLSMPGMEGPELARALRQLDPGIPVLVMSGYSDSEVAEKLAGTGVSEFVKKPFRPQELIARLGQALSRETPAGNTP